MTFGRIAAQPMAGLNVRHEDRASVSPIVAKAALLMIVALAAVAGALATRASITAHEIDVAGADWARLMRGMAALKLIFCACATAAVVWRLGSPISLARWLIYAVTCSAMWSGSGLIWGLEHIRLGALLLHGGLIVAVVVFWTDPMVSARLDRILHNRRRA